MKINKFTVSNKSEQARIFPKKYFEHVPFYEKLINFCPDQIQETLTLLHYIKLCFSNMYLTFNYIKVEVKIIL